MRDDTRSAFEKLANDSQFDGSEVRSQIKAILATDAWIIGSTCTDTLHNSLRPGAFNYCPECGTDLVAWRKARHELQKDIAAMEDGH